MKNRKNLIVVVMALLLVEVSSLFLMYKASSDKPTKLDSVSLKQELKDPEMFAIMLEQEDGTYKESTSTSWPTDMMYNSEMSGCIDNNGNKIDGILSYDSSTNVASVDTNSTSYCYLYFDNIPNNLYELCSSYSNINECIQAENNNISYISDLWQSTLEDDGIRYVGTNPKNYICFGTTAKTTCTGDTDKYMYRIIGFFEDANGTQHMKLIKKEALNTGYAWDSTYTSEIEWADSDVYNGINGSYFLTDTTNYPYMAESTWTDKIATWEYTATNTQTYYKFDSTSNSSTSNVGAYYYYSWPVGIYNSEHKIDTTTGCYQTSSGSAINCTTTAAYTSPQAKIGLMYASDYALSLGESAATMEGSTYTNRTTLKTGWMHLSNNDSATLSTTAVAPPSSYEWTMSRYGLYGYYYAFAVGSTGYVDSSNVYYTSSVRPVFYLTSDVKITGGEGTSSNPFIIG